MLLCGPTAAISAVAAAPSGLKPMTMRVVEVSVKVILLSPTLVAFRSHPSDASAQRREDVALSITRRYSVNEFLHDQDRPGHMSSTRK